MATNRLAELAMNSRHPRAVASASSLGSRLQPVPVPVCQQLLQEWGVELGGEYRAVTAGAGTMDGCAVRAGLLEMGSPSSLGHRSLFHPELPETVRWSFIIDLIHI